MVTPGTFEVQARDANWASAWFGFSGTWLPKDPWRRSEVSRPAEKAARTLISGQQAVPAVMVTDKGPLCPHWPDAVLQTPARWWGLGLEQPGARGSYTRCRTGLGGSKGNPQTAEIDAGSCLFA